MQIVNLATVNVATTAGGTEILSSAQARIATTEGLNCVIINPVVNIVLVDNNGLGTSSLVPGAVTGTVANSPIVCPAGVPTVVMHRSGAIRGISTSGTTVTQVALGCAP